jgi:hypothetical protein
MEVMLNLVGQYVFTADDIAESLVEYCDTSYNITIAPDTKMGFKLTHDTGILEKKSDPIHQKSGFYSIWKDHHCLYTGKSGTSMGTRLGRFVKEVRRMSRSDEKHPAATKYRSMWGEDFSNMTIRLYPLVQQTYLSHDDIEKSLIRMLKPLLNVRGKK